MPEKIYSDLMRELSEGKFVFTGELEPEKAGDCEEPIKAAKDLLGLVTACNVTDNPQSFAYVNSLAASYKIQAETGMECVYQLRCADRNRMHYCLISLVLLPWGSRTFWRLPAITSHWVTRRIRSRSSISTRPH